MDASRHASRDASREVIRDASRQGCHQARRDANRDASNDASRQGPDVDEMPAGMPAVLLELEPYSVGGGPWENRMLV